MKLTLFLVVLGFCYCASYESIDVGPGSLEVASMADQNYGDLGQRQLERDYIFDLPANSILEMRKRKTKSQSGICSEKTGGCFYILARSLRSDPKLVIAPPLMQNEISDHSSSKRKEEAKASCPEELGRCSATSIARFLRSGSKEKNPAQPKTDVPCVEKFGGCHFTIIRTLRSGNPFSTVVKKTMDSSPDYVNRDEKYSDNDYQS